MNRLIALSGSVPLNNMHFRSARLAESLSENCSGTVHIESESAALDTDEFLGKTLCLSFETRSRQKRYFDGVVVEMEQGSMAASGRCAYRLELKSWTWLLGKNREFRVYQNLSVSSIVAEVIGRNKHSSVRFSDRTQGTNRVWEYLVQFGESDLNFIRRILEQEGIYFYFEHAENQHTLVLVDPSSAHSLCPESDILNYNPASIAGRFVSEEVISIMTLRKSIEPSRHAHADYNFKIPSASLLVNSQGPAKHYNSAFEVFEYPGVYTDDEEGTVYSKIRHEEALVKQQLFSATTTARGVQVGRILNTVCKDNPAFSKSLLIVSTLICLHEAEPEANGGTYSDFECQFDAIESAQPFRPYRLSRKPHVKGPLPALVVGPEGREIHTDEFGRVKIQFYWDRYGKRDQNSSCWVRVATPAAGKGWGFLAIPRIGQEVVVSFENGDPDRPLVTGTVYNAEQRVPYPLPGHKTVSGWRTQSTEGATSSNFNELRFDDKVGCEYVWFQAEKDYLSLIKNNSNIEIGGSSNHVIHGNLIEEIKADVSRTVLGQLCQQVEKALSLTVNDDLLAKVEGLLSVIGNGQIAISTADQFSLKSQASTDLQSTGNLNMHTLSQGNIKADSNLKLTAGSILSLNVGGSSVVISATGIALNGPSISFNSSAAQHAAGSSLPTPAELAKPPSVVEPPVDPLV